MPARGTTNGIDIKTQNLSRYFDAIARLYFRSCGGFTDTILLSGFNLSSHTNWSLTAPKGIGQYVVLLRLSTSTLSEQSDWIGHLQGCRRLLSYPIDISIIWYKYYTTFSIIPLFLININFFQDDALSGKPISETYEDSALRPNARKINSISFEGVWSKIFNQLDYLHTAPLDRKLEDRDRKYFTVRILQKRNVVGCLLLEN